MAKIPCTYFQQGNCRRGDKCFYKIEKVAAPTKEPKRTNGPAPKKKASAKAAPCITQRYARIAKGKGLPKATKAMKEQCHRAVVFSSKVGIHQGSCNWWTTQSCASTTIEKSYPRRDMVPKTDPLVIHRSLPAMSRKSSSSSTSTRNPHAVFFAQMTKAVSPAICVGRALVPRAKSAILICQLLQHQPQRTSAFG